jgi:hypothetical protein
MRSRTARVRPPPIAKRALPSLIKPAVWIATVPWQPSVSASGQASAMRTSPARVRISDRLTTRMTGPARGGVVGVGPGAPATVVKVRSPPAAAPDAFAATIR